MGRQHLRVVRPELGSGGQGEKEMESLGVNKDYIVLRWVGETMTTD